MTETIIQKYGLEGYIENPVHPSIEIPEPQWGIEDTARKEFSANLDLVYPRIDLSFLSMKHPEQGIIVHDRDGNVMYGLSLPRFSVYHPHYPICSIRFDFDANSNIPNRSPPGLNNIDGSPDLVLHSFNKSIEKTMSPYLKPYKFPQKSLNRGFDGGYILNGKTVFNGFLPAQTKEKIRKAQPFFNKFALIIIAEAQHWLLAEETTLVPPSKDPLIVGVQEKKAYLIDCFDPTPIENYVRREFKIKNK